MQITSSKLHRVNALNVLKLLKALVVAGTIIIPTTSIAPGQQAEMPSPTSARSAPLSLETLRNATYRLPVLDYNPLPTTPEQPATLFPEASQTPSRLKEMLTVTLRDGVYDSPEPPETRTFDSISLLEDRIAVGDLSGDGLPDAVVPLLMSHGNSGEFFLAVVQNASGRPSFLAAAVLAESLSIKRIRIDGNRFFVDLLENGWDDPRCCPTFPRQATFSINRSTLEPTFVPSLTQGPIPASSVSDVGILSKSVPRLLGLLEKRKLGLREPLSPEDLEESFRASSAIIARLETHREVSKRELSRDQEGLLTLAYQGKCLGLDLLDYDAEATTDRCQLVPEDKHVVIKDAKENNIEPDLNLACTVDMPGSHIHTDGFIRISMDRSSNRAIIHPDPNATGAIFASNGWKRDILGTYSLSRYQKSIT